MAKQQQHPPPRPLTFEHLGSLITYHSGGKEHCLGYLLHSPEHGVFEPTFGKVDVAPEHVVTHNKALGDGLLAGLDKNCKIGMHGTFYFTTAAGDTRPTVRTWDGQLVSADYTTVPQGKQTRLTFRRNGMEFTGTLRSDENCFDFQRVR